MAPLRPSALRLVDPEPRPEELEPLTVDVPGEEFAPGMSFKDGVLHVDHGDGSTTIDFDPPVLAKPQKDGEDFYANLVDKFDGDRLSTIASELMDGIKRDIDSRKEWMETEARGIQLLGLKLEEPRGDMGSSSAPLEGMSTVRHPLLLEATLNFQATAIGEFLPAGGPVKVRNDTPQRPSPPPSQQLPAPPSAGPPAPAVTGGAAGAGASAPAGPLPAPPGGNVLPFPGGGPAGAAPQPSLPALPGIGHNGGPPLAPAAPPTMPNPAQAAVPTATEVAQPINEEKDSLAAALEQDFNHYLTTTATEYVPETDKMFFGVAFRGDGFKKVYNCPLRRRPVSEIVDTKDFIVSNNATTLENCSRITHRIKMPRSTLKRMQYLGVYADVPLDLPATEGDKPDPVETQIDEIEGVNKSAMRPEDQPYEIYESYCELDLDEFAPTDLKGRGLPLPYRVTIEVGSKKILSIVRNWKEADGLALPKQFFVQFPFIRGLGFYGLGFVHVLGNTTSALTAMWREMLDSGMFSNFPGFLYLKALGRQLSNQIRVPPGGGFGIDAPVSGRIQDAVMPLPYKEIGASFTGFAQWVEQGGQRVGQTAQISVGEGKQDAPVGTTLALIEQATKLLNAVHKRLHGAQDKEFQLLKERFREDPEAFWRHNKKPAAPWEKEQFIKALDDYNLVPVADPNNPTSLHRVMKVAAIEGLAQKYPLDINRQEMLRRVMRVLGVDSEGLIYPQSLPPPPDPRMEAIKAKNDQTDKTMQAQQETAIAKGMIQIITTLKQLESQAQDRESKERIEQLRLQMENMRARSEMANDREQQVFDLRMKGAQAAQDAHFERQKTMQEMWADVIRQASEMQAGHVERQDQRQADMMDRAHEARMTYHSAVQEHDHAERQHRAQMARDDEAHKAKLSREKELNDEKIRAARAMARATPKAKKEKK